MIGYSAFEAYGRMWRLVHGSIIPYSLPHHGRPFDTEQARVLLKEKRAHLIRWESCFDVPAESAWWHLIKDSDPDIGALAPKARNQVRRGLRDYRVERCGRELIAEQGHEVYRAAYERYATFERQFSPQEFSRAVLDMPDSVECWAVFDRRSGGLVGFGENIVDGEACFYSSMWFRPDSLRGYASYALLQEMNTHYLIDRNFRYVSDGARNISHQTGIHQFLEQKFSFRKAYCTLNVVYSPLIDMAVRVAFPLRRPVGALTRSSRFDVLMRQEELRRQCQQLGAG